MTAHVYLTKRDNGTLTPSRAADADALGEYPKGATVKAALTLPKSPDMLRWYWALIGHVAKGTGRDKDSLSYELLLRTGRFESLVLSTGREHFIPRSIAAMQYPQFKSYVDDAVEMILTDFLAGIRRVDLLREIGRMTGTQYSDFPVVDADTVSSPESSQGTGEDGAGAETQPPVAQAPAPTTLEEFDALLSAAAADGTEALKAAWEAVPNDMRAKLKTAMERRLKPAARAADGVDAES